jgi:hypothetical protein
MIDAGFNAALRANRLPTMEKQIITSFLLNALPDQCECGYEQSRPEEALEVLKRSAELAPNGNYIKWMNLAQLQEGKDALECYQKVRAASEAARAGVAAAVDDDRRR